MKKAKFRIEVVSDEVEIDVDDDMSESDIKDMLDDMAHESVRVVDIDIEGSE